MRRLRIGIAVFLGIAALLWAGMAGAAATDAEKCESSKNKEAGKYASCLLKAEAKAVKTGGTADTSKCALKFMAKWAKIESKGACPTQGDQTLMRTFISDCAGCVSDYVSGAIVWCDCLLGMEPTPTATPTATPTPTPTATPTPVPFCALAGGVEDGPGCWFVGAQGESCDSACANAGLVYDPATATHAGSGGTLANCLNVLALLGADSGINQGDLPGCFPDYIGCWVDSLGYGRCPDPVTDGPSAISGYARACACQEP